MACTKYLVVALLAACGGNDKAPAQIDSGVDAPGQSGTAATTLLASVGVTTLVGASPNTGQAGTFSDTELVGGDDAAPKLSNTLISSIPGTPAKPLFVGQGAAYDSALIAVDGLTGSFQMIYGGFRAAVSNRPIEERRMLFHDNAVRIYRL